jgi:hypothetical protein
MKISQKRREDKNSSNGSKPPVPLKSGLKDITRALVELGAAQAFREWTGDNYVC